MAVIVSCSRHEEDGNGCIRFRMDEVISSVRSRAGAEEIPDTNDFILEVSGPDGRIIYSGLYGNAPESLSVPAGNCNVSIRSCEFSVPKFACPQYGDDQCIVVPSGGTVDVLLNCRQLNSGVRLKIDSGFLSAYPRGALLLRSSEGGLTYSYSESRIAYFLPGNVSLVLTNDGVDAVLMTRRLESQEILSVNIKVNATSQSSGGGLSVQLDTARVWTSEDYVIGGDSDKGNSPENAMTVAQARASAGMEDVWVGGYIVGGDLSSSVSGISFTGPFKSTTNIAIAARSSVSDKSSCLSVQLPSGTVRDALNLVDNPSLLGSYVCLYGDIAESYFGLVGIKNVADCRLK